MGPSGLPFNSLRIFIIVYCKARCHCHFLGCNEIYGYGYLCYHMVSVKLQLLLLKSVVSYQSINQPTNQSINQSIDQSINQYRLIIRLCSTPRLTQLQQGCRYRSIRIVIRNRLRAVLQAIIIGAMGENNKVRNIIDHINAMESNSLCPLIKFLVPFVSIP